MKETAFWYFVAGLTLFFMAFVSSKLKKLPVSSSLVYFGIGIVLGPLVLGRITLDLLEHSKMFEHFSELAVLIAVFATGLKLHEFKSLKDWAPALLLAFVSMAIGIAGVALFGYWGLGFTVGASVLLGAVLAPTDPVLASSLRVKSTKDRDRLRFALTGEAGFNDGSAFPFVFLGLGLMGLHELGPWGGQWFLVDVLWAFLSALVLGSLTGAGAARIVAFFKKNKSETQVFDDLLSIGLLAITYGIALSIHAYGFVACFIAGLAFRRMERVFCPRETSGTPETTQTMLVFSEQVERILEFILVMALGVLVTSIEFSWASVGLALLILLVIRPLSVLVLGCAERVQFRQIVLISWFGVRGVGSIYYLTFALNNGVTNEAKPLISVVVVVICVSILLHGISAGPLMRWYDGVD